MGCWTDAWQTVIRRGGSETCPHRRKRASWVRNGWRAPCGDLSRGPGGGVRMEVIMRMRARKPFSRCHNPRIGERACCSLACTHVWRGLDRALEIHARASLSSNTLQNPAAVPRPWIPRATTLTTTARGQGPMTSCGLIASHPEHVLRSCPRHCWHANELMSTFNGRSRN